MLASTVHGEMRDKDIEAIPGSPPDLRRLPPGCSFAPRCRYAVTACTATVPDSVPVTPGHFAACSRVGEIAAGDAGAGKTQSAGRPPPDPPQAMLA